MRDDPITEAIARAGSVKALGERLGVRPQAISQWRSVPARHVLAVEALTGISRHAIRPDVFGPSPSPFPAPSQTQSPT